MKGENLFIVEMPGGGFVYPSLSVTDTLSQRRATTLISGTLDWVQLEQAGYRVVKVNMSVGHE